MSLSHRTTKSAPRSFFFFYRQAPRHLTHYSDIRSSFSNFQSHATETEAPFYAMDATDPGPDIEGTKAETYDDQVTQFLKGLSTIAVSGIPIDADGTRDKCGICRQEYSGEHEPIKAPCGHHMCREGLELWLRSDREHNTCPACRAILIPAEHIDAESSVLPENSLPNWFTDESGWWPTGEPAASDVFGITGIRHFNNPQHPNEFTMEFGFSPPYLQHVNPISDDQITWLRGWTLDQPQWASQHGIADPPVWFLRETEGNLRRTLHWILFARALGFNDFDTQGAFHEAEHAMVLRDILLAAVPAQQRGVTLMYWRAFDERYLGWMDGVQRARRVELWNRVFTSVERFVTREVPS